jgi:ribosomal protein S18 acetylase RimI-like enzyme
MQPSIEITQKLQTPEQAFEVAQIFYEAFRLKIHHLDLFPRSTEQAIRILTGGFRPANGFYALEDGHILGVVGLDWPGGNYFLHFTRSGLAAEFGGVGALWRLAWIRFNHWFSRPHAQEVRIAAIAVAGTARGKGVGSLLLERVFEHARQHGCRAVVLEVIDTNPRARKLYEQLGFKTIRTEWTGPVTARAGFTGFNFMRKNIS